MMVFGAGYLFAEEAVDEAPRSHDLRHVVGAEYAAIGIEHDPAVTAYAHLVTQLDAGLAQRFVEFVVRGNSRAAIRQFLARAFVDIDPPTRGCAA